MQPPPMKATVSGMPIESRQCLGFRMTMCEIDPVTFNKLPLRLSTTSIPDAKQILDEEDEDEDEDEDENTPDELVLNRTFSAPPPKAWKPTAPQ